MSDVVTLPALRPVARHKAYYDELRAIDAQVGAQLETEARAMRGERGLSIRSMCALALRYRLKFAALLTLLEDRNVVACGTYDRMQGCNVRYADGTLGRFAPMRLLRDHIDEHGLPDAAPGCEE